MEEINLNIDPRYVKNLKEFFSFPEVKKYIETNNFDALFAEYEKYKTGKCNWSHIIRIFDYLKIDWIKHASYIPRYAYSDRNNIENLELPKNITKIDGPLRYDFSTNTISNITYDGTVEEFKKIFGSDTLKAMLKPGGKIICSDGNIERASV